MDRVEITRSNHSDSSRLLVVIAGGSAEPLAEARAVRSTLASLDEGAREDYDIAVIDIGDGRILTDVARSWAAGRESEVITAWSPGTPIGAAADLVVRAAAPDLVMALRPGDRVVPDLLAAVEEAFADPTRGVAAVVERTPAGPRVHAMALRRTALDALGGWTRFSAQGALRLDVMVRAAADAGHRGCVLEATGRLDPTTVRAATHHPDRPSAAGPAADDRSTRATGFWRACRSTYFAPASYYAARALELERDAPSWVDSDDRVLDLGCGNGVFTRILARNAREVVGVDLSPSLIEQARIAARATGCENVRFDIADVTRRTSLGLFDIVTVFGVISTIPDDAAVRTLFDDVSRALRPGGTLALRESVSLRGERVISDRAAYPATYRTLAELLALCEDKGLHVAVDVETKAFGDGLSNRAIRCTRSTSGVARE